MKKLLILILMLAMILTLTACAQPAVVNPDGSDTIVGVAIKTALNIVETLAITAISIAGAAWAAQAKNKVELQNINTAVERVIDMTKQTVGELKQTVVDKMKEANDDGKLTPEQIEELKEEVINKTLIKLDDPTKDLIAAAGADLCALITGAAEDWIDTLKRLNAPSVVQIPTLESENQD